MLGILYIMIIIWCNFKLFSGVGTGVRKLTDTNSGFQNIITWLDLTKDKIFPSTYDSIELVVTVIR
jgi:hypothetical protein